MPSFVEPVMENVTAIKGQDVEFKCQIFKLGKHMVAFARADTPPRLIAFNEKVFRQRHKYEIRQTMKDNEWILVVKNVEENDIGGYSCQLNTDPVLSKTGYLRIRVPPYVARTTAAVVEVREGQNVTLTCRAFGDPPPTVVWRRQDRQIIRFNGVTGYGATVFNGSDLTIIKVSRKHMSEYICVASNGVPPDESWTVKLHVTFEPTVVPQAEIVQVALGSQISLVCNAEAWPRPLMKWGKDGQEIFNSSTFSFSNEVSGKYRSTHILTIKNVSKNEFGTYRCIAINDNGEHFADIVVKEGSLTYNKFAAMFIEGSGYPDHDSDDDDDDDDDNDSDDDDNNGNTIDNNDYNNNHSIISSYKLENSSDSMRKSAETFQIEPYSGRFLSTHSSQYRKGHVRAQTSTAGK
uniref:Ig-like domain-containing protein n=1 Tax=Wuchereria bancrofti TaxID=6293 RepID=A0AAF5Q2D8_WUCBA